MAHSADKITWDASNPGVSTRDVRAVLGIESDDYKNLCTSNVINKWAKYKPVRRNTTAYISYSTRKSLHFGLDIPYCTLYAQKNVMNERVHDIVYNNASDRGWNYLKPRGSVGDPYEFYRICDFQRSKDELTPSSTGDPTVNLQGYNHSAQKPFIVALSTQGLKTATDEDGKYYEINIQETQSIDFTFTNNVRADISLQELIDLDSPHGSGVAWRPVIQVFSGYIHLNSENYNDRLPWYERDKADVEVASYGAITTGSDSFSVSIPVNTEYFRQEKFINRNESFHLCTGIGCVNTDFTSWADDNTSLFIPPYTDEEFQNKEFPFYLRFKVVSHASKIQATGLKYHVTGLGWLDADGTPYFTVSSIADSEVRLTMTVEKSAQSVDFVAENGEAQTSGAVPMNIYVEERLDGVLQSTIYLTPANSEGQTSQYINVPAGDSSERVTLYAKFNTPTGTSWHRDYYLFVRINGGTEEVAGQFSITKTQNA